MDDKSPSRPKPTRPCSACGSHDWWWRETFGIGEWLCCRCHPNPNKEEEGDMPEEVELVNGHFIVKGQKEVKPKEKEVQQKQYNEEVLALRDRVIRGNQKLFDALEQIKKIAHDTEEWSRQMDRWNEAQGKLHFLCLELKAKGYLDCLYLVNGKRTKSCIKNADGFWCQVCPSSRRYWEEEFSTL